MGEIFNIQNSQFFDSILTERRNLSGTQEKAACGKSSSCRFSAVRNSITITKEYVTFGFSFRVLVFFPSRKVLMSLPVNDTNFSVF